MTNLGVNPLIRKLRITITRSYIQIQKHNMIMVTTRRSAFKETGSRNILNWLMDM